VKLTVITHFYNEEYLLPWWLKFHREVFDDGILIDHGSTDRSREIIAELCPDWRVVDTKLEWFDPVANDLEVNQYEREAPGWKIALNITEFLCGDVRSAIRKAEKRGLRPYGVSLIDQERDHQIEPSPHMPIHKQRHWGIVNGGTIGSRRRLLHCYPFGTYHPGRHAWVNEFEDTEELTVVHLFCSPMTDRFIARKLQIKDKIANPQVNNGNGWQHYLGPGQIMEMWKNQLPNAVFLPDQRFWRESTRCFC
jgi:hypothetical protein